MYFVIQNGTIEATDKKTWQESQDSISVFSSVEWQEQVELRNAYNFNQPHGNIHFCKIESHAEYMFGTMCIPIKKNPARSNTSKVSSIKDNLMKDYGFAFYIIEGSIIFIDDTDIIFGIIDKITQSKRKREYSMERFFYDFLASLIEDDLLYLELFEREISKVEEDILIGKYDDFNFNMLAMKKEIARMYRYYSQLTDVGEDLEENEVDFFGKDDIATFRVFTARASRLQSEAQVLREYSMQVQDVYQSEISIKQNNVMKILTIVTTIFLPLSLIAAWYGMNFVYMPEIGWKYGYPTVILLSMAVIVICLWIFKKKKFW